ncbi:class I SAM-dependent methyltransferase [uncultured Jatrophihabitans sp.]|uniref:class I SAM-dependent methyltransferase n=1 Tax=uncultured Jatrophihabitans sp. TaxID=1610747 RepID=UPI0035CA36A1
MSKTSPLRSAVGRGGRAALRQLPPPARLRLRQVKRAALGQPPVPTKRAAKARPAAAKKPTTPKTPPVAAPRLADPGPRRAEPGSSRLETRRSNIFATAARGGRALEIGPAHNAILPKRDGFDTRTVDYLDRAGLVEKYKDFAQYSPDDIEDVDYVLPPGAAMGDIIEDRFDLVLASHVLEHTTSLIDFVNECARLLRPGGVLALVVPDHRFCFDRFRERSSIGRVIDASIDPKSVHTVGTLTEFGLNAVRHRGVTSWAPNHSGKYSLAHDMDFVRSKAASATSGSYVDVHHWIFSPHHLRLLLHDLFELDYITLREAHFHDTIGHEFFLNLTVESTGSGLSRTELMSLADEELRTMDVPEWEPADAT